MKTFFNLVFSIYSILFFQSFQSCFFQSFLINHFNLVFFNLFLSIISIFFQSHHLTLTANMSIPLCVFFSYGSFMCSLFKNLLFTCYCQLPTAHCLLSIFLNLYLASINQSFVLQFVVKLQLNQLNC